MTEYRDTDIAAVLDSIEDNCRPSFEYMPDLVADLLVGYLAQIRLSITLPEFPSMSVSDWERQQRIASYGGGSSIVLRSDARTEDPTYREAWMTATDVACPLCLAARDTDCHTASGTRATKSHQGRIYARMRAIQSDDCNPRGMDRVFIDAVLLKDDDPTLDDILDAEDRRVLAARQQMLDAAERVRQERAAQAILAASSAEEVVVL